MFTFGNKTQIHIKNKIKKGFQVQVKKIAYFPRTGIMARGTEVTTQR